MIPSRAVRPWLLLLCAALPARAAVVRMPTASFAPAPVFAVAAVAAFPALPVSAVPLPFVPVPVLPVSAASAAVPEGWSAYFDGTKPAVEGERVSVTVLPAGGSASPATTLRLAAVRAAVREADLALSRSVRLGEWNGPDTTLDDSACGDAAPKLAAMLRARGIPARLIEAELHYYVLVPSADGPIIVDPTIRQFFGRRAAPRSIPRIFAGTLPELNGLYGAHARSKTTRFDPWRIYFSEAVVREDRLASFEARLASNEASPELQVLREFRDGPRASIPPPPPHSGLILP